MAQEIIAVKCKQCGKLHSKTGRYIKVIKLEITGHRDEEQYARGPEEQVTTVDTIVCDNDCLQTLVKLRGF